MKGIATSVHKHLLLHQGRNGTCKDMCRRELCPRGLRPATLLRRGDLAQSRGEGAIPGGVEPGGGALRRPREGPGRGPPGAPRLQDRRRVGLRLRERLALGELHAGRLDLLRVGVDRRGEGLRDAPLRLVRPVHALPAPPEGRDLPDPAAAGGPDVEPEVAVGIGVQRPLQLHAEPGDVRQEGGPFRADPGAGRGHQGHGGRGRRGGGGRDLGRYGGGHHRLQGLEGLGGGGDPPSRRHERGLEHRIGAVGVELDPFRQESGRHGLPDGLETGLPDAGGGHPDLLGLDGPEDRGLPGPEGAQEIPARECHVLETDRREAPVGDRVHPGDGGHGGGQPLGRLREPEGREDVRGGRHALEDVRLGDPGERGAGGRRGHLEQTAERRDERDHVREGRGGGGHGGHGGDGGGGGDGGVHF